MPATQAKVRKLLKAKAAKPVWNKFGEFGIQLLTETSEIIQNISLGVDVGTKFEGYSVSSKNENLLNIKLNLPDKSNIKRKMEERSTLRRTKRRHKLRSRKARYNNRVRVGFIAPSQLVVIKSRLKILRELFKIYPISVIGLEDVCFNHYEKRWGKNFSTMEIGKNKLRAFLKEKAKLFEFKGYKTKELREKYGYKKISDKSKNVFESHCCDSLALACEVLTGSRIEPNKKLTVVDDTYRPVRRKLHKVIPIKNNIRKSCGRGTVFGLQKGKIIGYKGKEYLLTGVYKNTKYRISNKETKTPCNHIKKFSYISKNFNFIKVN